MSKAAATSMSKLSLQDKKKEEEKKREDDKKKISPVAKGDDKKKVMATPVKDDKASSPAPSPVSKSPAATTGISEKDLVKTRRRLSVVAASGTKQHTLDGVGQGAAEEKEKDKTGDSAKKCFKSFSLFSHVGFVPFNAGKVNQDRGVAVSPFCGKNDKAFFGVFDGHGALGHDVSSYVQKNLSEEISKQTNLDADPEAALSKAFVDCNSKLAKGHVDCTFSGTTVITCYVSGKTVYSANAGDSRAVLARMEKGTLTAVALSDDQKPEREDEAKRIRQNNGRVEACKGARGESIGPLRVWLLSSDVPGLAMTRSFGDLIAASVGVIPKPEVWKRTLDDHDKFMILASDGVWEFISSQEAVDIVNKYPDGESACKALYEESAKRWRAEEEVIDDITCLVVYF